MWWWSCVWMVFKTWEQWHQKLCFLSCFYSTLWLLHFINSVCNLCLLSNSWNAFWASTCRLYFEMHIFALRQWWSPVSKNKDWKAVGGGHGWTWSSSWDIDRSVASSQWSIFGGDGSNHLFLSRCVKHYNADMVRYLILLYLEMQAKKCWLWSFCVTLMTILIQLVKPTWQ